jgi:hypothetical protein
MAERKGNWFTGYYGQANYTPDVYHYKSDSFYRNPNQAQTDQMDQATQSAMLQKLWQQGFQTPTNQGPSAAELQLQRGMRERQNAAWSLLGGGGMNPALARRRALMARERSMGDFNEQAAILRAQEEAQRRGEQMQTQALYGQLLGGMRGQNQALTEADRQALMQLEALRGQQQAGVNSLLMQRDISNAGGQTQGGLMTPLLSGLSTLGAAAVRA